MVSQSKCGTTILQLWVQVKSLPLSTCVTLVSHFTSLSFIFFNYNTKVSVYIILKVSLNIVILYKYRTSKI